MLQVNTILFQVVVGKWGFWDIDLGKFPKLGQFFFCTEFSRKIKKIKIKK